MQFYGENIARVCGEIRPRFCGGLTCPVMKLKKKKKKGRNVDIIIMQK